MRTASILPHLGSRTKMYRNGIGLFIPAPDLIPVDNRTNGGSIYAEKRRHVFLKHCFAQFTNLICFFHSQFGSGAFFSGWQTALKLRVLHVFFTCSRSQMIRVNTFSIIARMHQIKASWNRPLCLGIAVTMGSPKFSITSERPISRSQHCSRPIPTSILGNFITLIKRNVLDLNNGMLGKNSFSSELCVVSRTQLPSDRGVAAYFAQFHKAVLYGI